MGDADRSVWKKYGVAALVFLGLPLLLVGPVGVKTWAPLQKAKRSLSTLETHLGSAAAHTPQALGEIPPQRMEDFLELRAALVVACDDYGTVREGFDAVAALDTTDAEPDARKIGNTALDLGGAAFAITPYLARYFELRNAALLEAEMGFEEYAYIYAIAYREQLLSDQTRAEIFSDGDALSPAASKLLSACLERQVEAATVASTPSVFVDQMQRELERMREDPSRLLWQDALPDRTRASVLPYRERLDRLFCGATAGLEMERGARRAIWIALE